MKDTFHRDTKTLLEEQLDATLSEHKPYMVLNIGTTGYDEDDIATRIYGVIYNYNKKTKQYEEGSQFKETLMPPPEYIDCIKTPDSVKGLSIRQVLRRNQIDIDAYCSGIGTISKEEMKKSYAYFMKGAAKCGVVFINSVDFIKYMEKIDAADDLNTLRNKLVLHSQTDLTSLVYPNAPSKSLQEIAIYAFQGVNVPTPELKAALLSDIVRVYGEGGKILSPQADSYVNATLAKEALSEKGHLKYQNSSLEDKFDILLGNTSDGKQVLEPMTPYIRGMAYPNIYTPETDTLKAILDTKKGFSVIMVSTSGLGSTVHNQPLHMTVIPYRLNNGKCETIREKGFDCMIGCNEAEVLEAKRIADKGGYDVFTRGNIDYEKYVEASLSGKLASATMVANKLADYAKEFPVEDYPIISCGGKPYLGKYVLFSQSALLEMQGLTKEDGEKAHEILCAIPGFTSIIGNVDFTNFLKEVIYNKFADKEDFGDRFCNLNAWTESDMSLEALAHHKYPEIDIAGSERKCCFIGRMVEAYAMDRASFLRDGQKTVISSAKPIPQNSNPGNGSPETNPLNNVLNKGEVANKGEAAMIESQKKPSLAPTPQKPLRRLEPRSTGSAAGISQKTLSPKESAQSIPPTPTMPTLAPASAPVQTQAAAPAPAPIRTKEEPQAPNLEKILFDMINNITELTQKVSKLTAKVESMEEQMAEKKGQDLGQGVANKDAAKKKNMTDENKDMP